MKQDQIDGQFFNAITSLPIAGRLLFNTTKLTQHEPNPIFVFVMTALCSTETECSARNSRLQCTMYLHGQNIIAYNNITILWCAYCISYGNRKAASPTYNKGATHIEKPLRNAPPQPQPIHSLHSITFGGGQPRFILFRGFTGGGGGVTEGINFAHLVTW